MAGRSTIAATAGLLLGSLLSLPMFAQASLEGHWMMEGGTEEGGEREVYVMDLGRGSWIARFTKDHLCSDGSVSHKEVLDVKPGKTYMTRCPSVGFLKDCTDVPNYRKVYKAPFTFQIEDENTIKGHYTTPWYDYRKGGKSPRGCKEDPTRHGGGDFTLRRKDACPTPAEQALARKILKAIYPNLRVPSGDPLTPEVVIFAFELIRRLDAASRTTTALSEFFKPTPYTKLSQLGKAAVKAASDYLGDPGSFKKNQATLAGFKQYEKHLKHHFSSATTGGPCGERADEFGGFGY